MTGKRGAVVGISNVVVARRPVAVVRLVGPILHVAIVAALVGGKQASGAVEVLLHPHAAADFVDACTQLLGGYLLIEAERLGDGAVCGRLADVGLLSVLVLSRLVHAALQGRACRQLLPTRRRLRGLREAFLERWIRQDAARDIDCNTVHHLRQSLAAFDVEAVLQLCDASRGVNLLHTTIVLVDGLYGGKGCCLAQHHIDRFHADAAVGDVRGGEADGHDDVACFALLRRHGSVGDVVRTLRQVALHVALVLHLAVHDVTSAVVRVHRVGSPSNRVFGNLVLQAVVLRHHHAANHSACLAYVELRREVLVILILVERIAPEVELVPDVLRHARVGPKDVEQALGVVLVEFGNRVALLVGCLGIVPTVANHVGREGTIVVVVGLHGIP